MRRGRAIEHLFRQELVPGAQILAVFRLNVAEAVLLMLHHVDAVGGHAIQHGVAVRERVGGLVPAVAAKLVGRHKQPGLDNGRTHGPGEQGVVRIVYVGGQIRGAIFGHNHPTHGEGLVERGHCSGGFLGSVGFVGRLELVKHRLPGVDQVHRHGNGYLQGVIHGGVNQQHGRNSACIVQRGSHIVAQEAGAATDADGIAVGQAAKVAGIGIVAGAVVVADAVADVAHGRLQLEVGVLVRLAKAGLGVNGGYQYHAAGGLVGHVGQAQILEVVQGVVLAGKLLVGVDQQVGVHTVGRAHAVIDAG